ncbi:hypothetical protein STAS_01710 [Striga asiatica]|uniref:Uncharacterized protein n=1 Tax=Striga asiatica TaxID=4170 RepID=A0A5A7NZY6_STRAF|nr:hypothetical protein STAS_01710 [Striga asiatica]
MAMAARSIAALSTAANFPPFRHAKPRFFPAIAASSTLRPITLIGPPEIYLHPLAAPKPSTNPALSSAAATEKRDPLSDLAAANFSHAAGGPPMGMITTGSLTFLSTGNPCLDFFFHVVPDTPPETLARRLELAWDHDPLMTLKLVCNLRAAEGTGKADEEGGLTAALWLHANHPKTLALNLDSFAGFGSSKDLLEILYRILEGPDIRKRVKQEHKEWVQMQQQKRREKMWRMYEKRSREMTTGKPDGETKPEPNSGEQKRVSRRNWRKRCLEKKRVKLEAKRVEQARRAVDRFNNDPDFQFLHNRVSDYFANKLRSDLEKLRNGDLSKISLAAKWCPSLDSPYDRVTLLCETIAKKIFPREEFPEYEGVEEAHYAYRVRDRLRKQVLVPLHKALELPDVFIGANDWKSINYERVTPDELRLRKRDFLKHDKERFCKYLDRVRKGEVRIDAGDWFPHTIAGGQVAELQYSRMLADMSAEMGKKKKMSSCLAICDISFYGLEVPVALGILVSELSDEPWKGKLITSGENPKLQTIDGIDKMKKKAAFAKRFYEWGNMDIQKVFDLLLKVAVEGGLKPEQMIKRLFVFSEMEFAKGSKNESETDYEAIVRKFGEKGYGDCVPEIVFWKVKESRATPVRADQRGVALVSGHSRNVMKVFLEEGRVSDMNPEAVMEAAIGGKEYEELVSALSPAAMATAVLSKRIPSIRSPSPHFYTNYLTFLTMASSSTPISLIGPPEIYTLPAAAAPPSAAESKKNPFVDQMVANSNNFVLSLPMGLTENQSPTFLSSGNPCLDFFFHVVPNTPPESLVRRLELAWEHDPLTALKLICNLRGVKGTGKSIRQGFYTAAIWLHENHPNTLAGNLDAFAGFGYGKDPLEILYRLLEGPDARQAASSAKLDHEMWKKRNERRKSRGKECKVARRGYYGRKLIQLEPEPRLSHEEKRILKGKRVVEKFNTDPDYRFLHERVSDYFARNLRSDMDFLNKGELCKISLAAKWCPTLYSSYDNATLLCETIGKKVFPRDEFPEYEGVEEAHYAYRVRNRLTKEILVPLRKTLQLPEVYMSANNWASLPYNRVASVAMKTYKTLFFKHDEERFHQYLDKVEKGEAKIAAGALLPHVIIADLDDGSDDGCQVAELQWKRMVDDMAKVGKLNNCLAVCDVSGSMEGTPMDVSVALGILVSELSEEPWKGKVITFSANPELQTVRGESLKEKTEFVREMEWGCNTDFQKVFDVLLRVAVDGKLKPGQMIKRVFVFSDMEFDQASRRPWEMDFEVIVRKFEEKGYGGFVPEIVFWNLRESLAMPVLAGQRGVALVSGFSKNLMKLFMKEGGDFNPVETMEAAISGEEYRELQVLD